MVGAKRLTKAAGAQEGPRRFPPDPVFTVTPGRQAEPRAGLSQASHSPRIGVLASASDLASRLGAPQKLGHAHSQSPAGPQP